ncbi:hypothetical protein Csa_016168 [Cucumis sativus]|nr:hypothetical protein Csa_016168 [Cucumis sativus]
MAMKTTNPQFAPLPQNTTVHNKAEAAAQIWAWHGEKRAGSRLDWNETHCATAQRKWRS